jgi:hypothetical protein
MATTNPYIILQFISALSEKLLKLSKTSEYGRRFVKARPWDQGKSVEDSGRLAFEKFFGNPREEFVRKFNDAAVSGDGPVPHKLMQACRELEFAAAMKQDYGIRYCSNRAHSMACLSSNSGRLGRDLLRVYTKGEIDG